MFSFFAEKQIFVMSELFIWKKLLLLKKQETDKEGRILVLDICVNDSEYVLINLYNAKTEKEQINILINIFLILEMFDINPKNYNYGGRF